MKVIIVTLCLAVAALAAVEEVIPILKHEANVEHDGHFNYNFETGHGIQVEQHGELKQFDKDNAGEVVSGSYKYTGDDGQVYSLNYVADENGYQPVGDHLPVAPPVPEAILRALEYIAAHPQKEDKH